MANPLFHWELMVNDVDQAKDFYQKVFDWEVDDEHFPNYPLIKTGDTPGGAFMAKPQRVGQPSFNVYFYTDDIESTLARATSMGATLIAPRTPMPGIGYWAIFADPDGIPIGLLQPE